MASTPPRNPGPPPAAGATEAALQRAAFAMQSGNPGEAERIAGELLARSPGDARAAQLLGFALFVQGRGAEAVEPLKRAVKQNRDPTLETQLAMALWQAGQIDDALKRFARAVERTPPFPLAFLEYGALLVQLGRHAEAVDVLKRGVALAPNFADMAAQLGNALARGGDRDTAREAFARALANTPPNLDALFNIAGVMKEAGCFAQAADAYRRMLEIDSREAGARVALGICQLEAGDSEAGYESLRAASRADPKILGKSMQALASAGRGRFWLRPSSAARFLKGEES